MHSSAFRGKRLLSSYWKSNVGPKTVHFWAPLMKWALVLAGLGDLARSPSQISISQNLALVVTGGIWARFATQIRPVNYNLMVVNLFVAGTGAWQLGRRIVAERCGESEEKEESR